MTTRRTLVFARPYQVEIKSETAPPLPSHEVLVETVYSAISAGTEMLFYRGQIPPGMSADATISGLGDAVRYPLSYGYCSVGKVAAVGHDVDAAWKGRRVFAFHPHASAFHSDPSLLIPIPGDLTDEQALFLPNMETAVNFVMDGYPLIGERVLVMGLGVVGLLTCYLLKQFPLELLVAVDGYANRIQLAQRWGINHCYTPEQLDLLSSLNPDLIYEVSSNPTALSTAIQLAGFGTRIVLGSWYGSKDAHLALGGSFHRNRVRLISSQVSSVDGQFANRWTKSRRLGIAMQHLKELPAADLITHTLPIESAPDAYQLVDEHPDQALQVIFTY